MNRHLHNAMLAFSAAGLVLLTGLIAAVPPGTSGSHTGSIAIASTDATATRSFQARIERGTATAGLLAETAAFTAQVATESALIAAFAQPADAAAQARADRQHRHQVRRSRAALALPYFSFAQGLRHNRS